MNEVSKPIPVADAETAPYWDGCREGRLLIQQCADCRRRRFPPHRLCPHCHSANADWVEATGRGKVYSWIVVNHPVPKEVYREEVPYVVALIELEEGVRMVSNIVGCDPHDVAADMPVSVFFEPADGGMVLPRFRPATGAA